MASSKSGKKTSKLNTFIDTKYVPLDNKIKYGAFAALVILPIVAFYFLMYSPNVKNIEALNKRKGSLLAELSKAQKAEKELSRIEAEVKETEELFKKTATVLPKEQEIPTLLTNISDLGKRAGLDFVQFRPGSEIPKDFYAEIPIDIQIKGQYHYIGYFLDQVSDLERIVTVNNIRMSGAQKEGNEMILSSNLRLVTYRFTGTQQSQGNPRR